MSDIIIYIFVILAEKAIKYAVEEGINYIIRKVVDGNGNTSTQVVYLLDTDGDGEADAEQVACTLETFIPDLSEGYTLCNRGNEVGLGYPAVKLVDANEVLPILQDLDDFISDGKSFVIDLDNDGANDDIIAPMPFDGTGDGISDFITIVDDDDNGLPDVSTDSPFYPIGSDEYQQIIETHSDNVPALDKSFKNYTVSEALLFLIFIGSAVTVIGKIFRRRKM